MRPPPDLLVEQVRADDWSGVGEALESAVEAGDSAWLVALLGALSAADERTARLLGRRAVEALALVPGAAPLLAQHTPGGYFSGLYSRHEDAGERMLGALLAASQGAAALAAALPLVFPAGPRWQRILSMWAQERVARGEDLRGEAAVVRFWARVEGPLGDLPLAPHPLEALAARHAHTFQVSSASGWGCPPRFWEHTPLAEGAAQLPTITRRRLSSRQRRRLSAAFASSMKHNGRAEVAVLDLSEAAGEGLTARLLRALPLACFNDLGEGGKTLPPRPAPGGVTMQTQAMSAAAVYAMLMSAAAVGGCTNIAWSAAWGRVGAWETLGALAGARAGSSAEAIAAAAEQCRWASFQIKTGWFDGVMSDPVAVCLRPDGLAVAVFAGTDAD